MSNEQNTAETKNAEASKKGRRGFLLRALLIVIVLAAIGWTLWYVFEGRWYADTDDAYVNGNVVQITPRVPGTVVSIGADDGDLVHAGQVLVKLDPSDAEVQLDAAEANLARTVRQVRGLYSSVEGAQADMKARQVALDKARADYKRRENLAKTGAISSEELAHARDALDAAQSALNASEQQYNSNKVLVDDTVVASHPDVKAASAKLRAAYLDVARTTLVAPVTGYVAKRTVQVGQRVQPSLPLMAVVPLHQVWVDANFKETQLDKMRLGQPVELESDLYGSDVAFHGKVVSLGIGTGSAFSLLPAQNATGNWIKIVQRIPVRISLDPQDVAKHPLRIGLSMTASVNLHDQNGPVLPQKAPTKPLFTTDVYQKQMNDANTLIARIIHQNMGHAKHH
ncbi:EmrA/EmrK family multidrug efflux transporter periplasmic adaptor subunit [Oleiagrimonas soli]|uniref:Hemolysin D n=1 Tax=Oleiagrimonas soli TaxID=1543381 RepID=A0A099CSF9_9GAMM|nr:EmrA/EmrK family multidrug efflux transporter periplasmic adaptor subunit [Oleiagrimonas soli]KGI76724.1 hemolysin D [Oleiagrimonas soli]MBB6185047.1 membrane fusion protein (multidrug efflux system) [Oleiagrimonas soli]